MESSHQACFSGYFLEELATTLPLQPGSAIASLYVCTMITSLLVGRFRVKERTIVRIGLAFSALGAFFAVKYPFPVIFKLWRRIMNSSEGYPRAVAGMDADRGLSMGLFNTTIYAGLSLLPIAAGLLTEVMSFEKLFLVSGCIPAGTFLLKD